MGDKITSKQIAEDAKVNVIPGFPDVITDDDHAVEIANKVTLIITLNSPSNPLLSQVVIYVWYLHVVLIRLMCFGQLI